MNGTVGQVTAVESASDSDGQAVDVVCDMGGGALVTADLALPPGVDAKPLPGDAAVLVDGVAEGSKQAVAFYDPATESKAANGEHRIYGRDPQGNTVCEIWCKGNGEIEITNFRPEAITIKSQGPIVFDSDDIKLGKNASRPAAGVGDYLVGSLSVAAIAAAIAAPNPSGSIKFAGQIVSGKRGVKL